MSLTNPDQLLGTCHGFCPEREKKERQRQRRLHVLELRPGSRLGLQNSDKGVLMIKEYSRPAAGKDATDSRDLRPPSTLLKVIEYMMTDLVSRTDIPWNEIYSFIFDRLRAVRQDLVIQRASCKESIKILECAVRFHIYAGYRLCEENVSKFEPKFNSDHCQECLKRLLVEYREHDQASKGRTEFESLYLLYNLGSFEVLQTSLQLPSVLRNHPDVKLAYNISINFVEGNFIRLRRLVQRCDFLQRCAIHRHLPFIRSEFLAIVNSGFCSRNIRFPAKVLARWLFLESPDEANDFCIQRGLDVSPAGILFKRRGLEMKHKPWPDKQSPELVQRDFEELSISDVILCNQLNKEHTDGLNQLPKR